MFKINDNIISMFECIKRVQVAIKDIKDGKMVIMIDDLDRENEGDLVYAAEFSTPSKINFLCTFAKGLICVPISKKISSKLGLPLMVDNQKAFINTAFTVSVDSYDCKTGISAYERDTTVRRLADLSSEPKHFLRPGHIFPIIANKNGVLSRQGHTEGSVDLCRISGLREVAVVCEIMNDDGTMARQKDLEAFSKKHSLNIVYIDDILKYRLQNDTLVEFVDSCDGMFFGQKAQILSFSDYQNNLYEVIVYNSSKKKLENIKIHRGLNTLAILKQKKIYDRLIEDIKFVQRYGGALVFLDSKIKNKHDKHIEKVIIDTMLKHVKLDIDPKVAVKGGLK